MIICCMNFHLVRKIWKGLIFPQNNALILTVTIYNYDVRRELLDPGSSSEVMYLNAYNQLQRFIPRKNVRFIDAPIYSFSGDFVCSICIVDVPVKIGEVTANMEFFVMNIESRYNAILRRNWLGEMELWPFHSIRS